MNTRSFHNNNRSLITLSFVATAGRARVRSLLLLFLVFILLLLLVSRPGPVLVLLGAFVLASLPHFLCFLPVVVAALGLTPPIPVLGVLDVHLGEQVLLEGLGEGLDVHVVAVATPLAAAVDVLLALGVGEVGDRAELGLDLLVVMGPAVGHLLGVLGVLLFRVFNVDVADDVVAQVVHHNHVLDLAVLHHLLEDLLVEVFVLEHGFLGVLLAHIVAVDEGGFDGVVLVHVLEADGLTNGGLVVNALAAVSVPAGAHLVEERAVYLVHFGAVHLRQTICHLSNLQQNAQYKYLISAAYILDGIALIFQIGFILSQQQQIINMYKPLLILTTLALASVAFRFPFLTSTDQAPLFDTIKYNGKGFSADLQSVLAEAISDSVIYYKDSFYSQATYISKQLKKAKEGDWHVVIIQNLTITKITDVSTGFYYWTEADTWALWYDTSALARNLLHLVIYSGNTGKDVVNVTTKDSSVGSGVSAETANVISSIVQSLDTTQDIAKYIQKYDGQKWSVLSVPFLWGTQYPEAWASLSVGNTYITYHKNVTLQKKQYSQIIYV